VGPRSGELGNVEGVPVNADYSGAALTLIDALSTLAVIGDTDNFQSGVTWLVDNVSVQ
jgi:mannosidase alpha-like ER degradation enhancer 1